MKKIISIIIIVFMCLPVYGQTLRDAPYGIGYLNQKFVPYTGANANLDLGSYSGRFDGGLGIGVAPDANYGLNILFTESGPNGYRIGHYTDITLDGGGYVYGSANFMRTTADTAVDNVFGYLAFMKTLEAVDIGEGFRAEVDCNTAGGDQHGFFADADFAAPTLDNYYAFHGRGGLLSVNTAKWGLYIEDLNNWLGEDDIYTYIGTGKDGRLYVNSDHFYIENVTQDMDIVLKVDDGGVAKTITFDADVNTLNCGDTLITTTGDIQSANLKVTVGAQLGDSLTEVHGINVTPVANQMLTATYSDTTANVDKYFIDGDYNISTVMTNNDIDTRGYSLDTDVVGTVTINDVGDYTHDIRCGWFDVSSATTISANNGTYTENLHAVRGLANYTGTPDASTWLNFYGGFFSSIGNMGTTGLTKHYGGRFEAEGTADVNYGGFFSAADATTNWGIWVDSGDMALDADDMKLCLGEANATDSYFQFGGANLEYYSSGMHDFLAADITTTASGIFETQVTTPLLETATTGTTLDIQPDYVGAGAGVEFFKNVSQAGDNPKLRFWGWETSGTPSAVYADMYVDQYLRLVFEGTIGSVLLDAKMQVGTAGTSSKWLSFGNNVQAALGYNSTGVDHPIFFGSSTATTRSPKYVFTHFDRRTLDFGVSGGTQPEILAHDGSATAANVTKMLHNSIDGIVETLAGDLHLISAGGDILSTSDIGIFDDTPHLTFADSDDGSDIAFQWHLDTSAGSQPFDGLTLWKGTDADGKSFNINPRKPIFHYDASDDNMTWTLADNAGATHIYVFDSDGEPVFNLSSDGDMVISSSFSPASDKAQNMGVTGTLRWDNIYADDFVNESAMFTGTDEEALELLHTLQVDMNKPDEFDVEALDEFIRVDNGMSINRLAILEAQAIKALQKKVNTMQKLLNTLLGILGLGGGGVGIKKRKAIIEILKRLRRKK